MKSFRQQVKEIKLWMIPFWLGSSLMVFALLFFGFLMTYVYLNNKIPPISGRLLMVCTEISLFSPIVGGGLMVLSGLGIGRRKRCPRCNKVLSIRDFDRMGDSFLCPYCLNDKFNEY